MTDFTPHGSNEPTILDGGEVELTPVQRVPARRGAPRDRSGQTPPPDSAQTIDLDRPGRGPSYRAALRSHRIRPERLFVAVTLGFLLIAVVKPWDLMTRSDSPQPTSAEMPASPVVTGRLPQIVQIDPSQAPSNRDWALVDWSFLASPDRHASWGFSWVDVPSGGGSQGLPQPRENWAGYGEASGPTEVVLGQNEVLALALTWPDSVRVLGISFEYLGGSPIPPTLQSSGRPEFVVIEPVPASIVVSWASPGSARGQAGPGPNRANSQVGGSVDSVQPHSGDFLIAPYRQPANNYTATIGWAWRNSPWAWPAGRYWITVATATGTTTMRIDLRNAPT